MTTFILAAVIRDEVYLKSARTLTPAQILMIPAQTVRDVFGRDAAFARAIVNELAERYRGLVRALKNEKLRTGARAAGQLDSAAPIASRATISAISKWRSTSARWPRAWA